MDFTRILLLICLASIIPGQLLRIPLDTSGSITLSDISVIVTVLTYFIYSFVSNKRIFLPKHILFHFIIFIFLATLSTILAFNTFPAASVISGSLFLFRFIFYFAITIVTSNVVKQRETENWLKAFIAVGVIFSLLGLLQLVAFPDLRLLTVFGWDPHSNRLVSSLIDPNFSGGLIVLFFITSLSLYIFKKRSLYLVFSLLFAVSILLTYSRSTYLALFTALIIIGLVKSLRMLLAILLIFIFVISAVPKSRDRVASGLTLDETAQSRIQSWQNAFSIFSKNYLFGVGFNTYRYAQMREGNFSFENPSGGNSGGGVDSSILLVAATTGIFGLAVFVLFLLAILKSLIVNIKTNYIKIIGLSSFISLIIHSQFVNSLFFPQIMLVFWFILGLSLSRKQ